MPSRAGASPAAIVEALATHHPGADTELIFRNAFELLVATVLSAQSTDRRVNEVTPALFARFPDPAALACAAQPDVEAIIHSTGFFRQKAKAIIGLSAALVDEHGGSVPADLDALVRLPGVGRKTANVVLGHALGCRASRRSSRAARGRPAGAHPHRRSGEGRGRADVALPADGVDARLGHADPDGRRICGPTPRCELCHARTLCPHAVTGTRRTRSSAGGRAAGPRRAAPARRRPPR
ncbi:MAG: endonuclease III [Vicinamibacterales bacterium]